jgi:glycosyltransferase involved in cell wall biosynthesis
MKIALFDPYIGKFTKDMENWWIIRGYEVRTDPKGEYDPRLAEWADIVWFDTCSNNLISATNPNAALLADGTNYSPWRLQDMPKKKVIVRPIDIDVWSGHHASVKWDLVDDCIFIAPHIRDIMMADSRPQQSKMKIHVIPHSVNLDRWTFRERKPGFKIAVVSEIWESKGIDYTLQIALKLKQIDSRYHIYYVGKDQQYHWHRFYMEEFIKRNKLPITFIDWVDDLDKWLDDKNYLLNSSVKEAFSAITAEAAAKGIRPILHAFGGYEPLWGDSGWVWQGIDDAVDMITDGQYDSQSYRDYLIRKEYTTEQMMRKIDKIIKE